MQKWIPTWLQVAGNVLRIFIEGFRIPPSFAEDPSFDNSQSELCHLSRKPCMLLQVGLHNRLRNWSDLLQIFKITLHNNTTYQPFLALTLFILTAILTDFNCSVLLLQKCLIYLAQSCPHVGYVKRNCRHDNSLAVRQCWTKRVKSLLVLSKTSRILMVFYFVL